MIGFADNRDNGVLLLCDLELDLFTDSHSVSALMRTNDAYVSYGEIQQP